jgi:hypothetical protein
MILLALKLREALDMYAAQLRGSRDDLDQETYNQDHINDDEWQTLCIIKEQLEPLYRCTKDLDHTCLEQDVWVLPENRRVNRLDGSCSATLSIEMEVLWILLDRQSGFICYSRKEVI